MTRTSATAVTLPTFAAPSVGELTDEMVSAYDEAGVIILENFVSVDDCAALKEQALTLVESFDPGAVKSVFSTTHQPQLDDRYFFRVR